LYEIAGAAWTVNAFLAGHVDKIFSYELSQIKKLLICENNVIPTEVEGTVICGLEMETL
jgi:hypothetical protein